jgi:thiopurine S-methyltransferase
MSNPDNALWQQCWRDRNIEFHQKTVNQLLIRYWHSLNLEAGSRVFVPLCGKSLDLLWLAQQGCEVIGIELSPIAVRAFFRENNLLPARRQVGRLTEWSSGPIRVFCGDIFALTAADLGPISAVYDRAALTALPETVRATYVAHLHALIPETCPIFLLTAEDPEEGDADGAEPNVAEELLTLYTERFTVELVHVAPSFQTDPEAPDEPPLPIEHKFYRLLPI